MSNTLFELVDEMQELYDMATDPETDPEALDGSIESVMGAIEVKACSYANLIKQLEMEQKQAEMVSQAFADKAKVRKNNIKRMKAAVLDTIQMTGSRKMVTDHFKLSIVKNGGKQPMEVDEIEKIPQDYLTMKPVANMEKIRQELEGGGQLDFARLKERGEHLGIR